MSVNLSKFDLVPRYSCVITQKKKNDYIHCPMDEKNLKCIKPACIWQSWLENVLTRYAWNCCIYIPMSFNTVQWIFSALLVVKVSYLPYLHCQHIMDNLYRIIIFSEKMKIQCSFILHNYDINIYQRIKAGKVQNLIFCKNFYTWSPM